MSSVFGQAALAQPGLKASQVYGCAVRVSVAWLLDGTLA